jgi:hypothetical protein
MKLIMYQTEKIERATGLRAQRRTFDLFRKRPAKDKWPKTNFW